MRHTVRRLAIDRTSAVATGRLPLSSGVRTAIAHSTILRTVGGQDIGSGIDLVKQRQSVLAMWAASARSPESYNVASVGEQNSLATINGVVESYRILSTSSTPSQMVVKSNYGASSTTQPVAAKNVTSEFLSLPPESTINLPKVLHQSPSVLQVILRVKDEYTPITEVKLADGTTSSKPTRSAANGGASVPSLKEEGLFTIFCPLRYIPEDSAVIFGCSPLDGAPTTNANEGMPAQLPFLKVGAKVLVNGRLRSVFVEPPAVSESSAHQNEGDRNPFPFSFLQLPLDGALSNIRPLPSLSGSAKT